MENNTNRFHHLNEESARKVLVNLDKTDPQMAAVLRGLLKLSEEKLKMCTDFVVSSLGVDSPKVSVNDMVSLTVVSSLSITLFNMLPKEIQKDTLKNIEKIILKK